MTNKIDRTKTKAKSVGTRTLAMVLCFVMLLTAIGSGSVLSAIAAGFDKGDAAVLANAVKLGADISAAKAEDKASDEPFVDDIEDGYTLSKKKSDADLVATGATYYNVDLYYGTSTSNVVWVKNISLSSNSGTYDATLAANTTYYFYFKQGADRYYGGGFNLPNDREYNLAYSGTSISSSNYIKYTTTTAGTYTFTVTINENDGKIKIAGGSGGSSISSDSWKVKGHQFGTNPWTDTESMTKDDVSGFYYIDKSFSKGNNYFRFVSSNGTDDTEYNRSNSDEAAIDLGTKYDLVAFDPSANKAIQIANTLSGNYTIWLDDDTDKFWVRTRYKTLTAPANVKINNNTGTVTLGASAAENATLTWDSVTNAAAYRVYKGSTIEATVVGTSYSIPRKTDSAGEYTVVAIPDATVPVYGEYFKSDASTAVTLAITPIDLPQPTITITKDGTAVSSANSYDTDIKVNITNYAALKDYCTFEFSGLANKTGPDANGTYSITSFVTDGASKECEYNGKDNSITVEATLKEGLSYYYTINSSSTSSTSAASTLKVFNPNYYVCGGITGISKVNGSTVSFSSDHWSDANSNLFINGDTGVPGKYSIVVTLGSNDKYFGFTDVNSTRHSFIYGEDSYNSYGMNLDIDSEGGIPEGGSKALYSLNGNEGAYILKKNKTYVIIVDQSVRNSDSDPYGRFYFLTDQVLVTPAAYKQTYNTSNATYNTPAADSSSDSGTVTAIPNYVTKSSASASSTLKAVANDGYYFVGWYNNSDFADSHRVSTDAIYTVTPNSASDVTYYALFKQNEPGKFKVNLAATRHGTVTAEWNGTTVTSKNISNDEGNEAVTLSGVPAGATVTLRYTPDTDYAKESVSAKKTNGSDVTLAESDASFTMPTSAVNVKANFDLDLGTADSGRYLLGQVSSSGNPDKNVASMTNQSLVVTKKTIETVEHHYVKIPKSKLTKYYSFYGISKSTSYTDLIYKNSDGNDVQVLIEDGQAKYYSDGPKYEGYDKDSNTYKYSGLRLNSLYYDDIDYLILETWYYQDSSNNWHQRYKYTVVLDEDAPAKAVVYAKDGAAPIYWGTAAQKEGASVSDFSGTSYTFGAIAKTEITQYGTAADALDDVAAGLVTTTTLGGSDTSGNTQKAYASSKYQSGSFTAGYTIKVKTTVASDYKNKYYVRGWCINGLTYCSPATADTASVVGVNTIPDTTNGEYELVYTIPEGQTDPVEITPIYYFTDAYKTTLAAQSGSKKSVEFVTFYLQGYSEKLQNERGWGNTPYIYPFYGDLSNVDNSFGTYPGQPMVNLNGTYSIEIPMANATIDFNRANNSTNVVKGITISNGYADHVHRNLIYDWSAGSNNDDIDHMQTYDYDDFYKIYHDGTKLISGTPEHPNTITFRIKDETETFNAKTYGGLGAGTARVNSTKNELTEADITAIGNANGWEKLTNFFGNDVNIFNQSYEKESVTLDGWDKHPLYVISTGYNGNIAGDYGTAWKIFAYDTSTSKYKLVQDTTNGRYAIPPSVLALQFDDATTSFPNAADYPKANHSVTGVSGNYTDEVNKYVNIYNTLYDNYRTKNVYITYEKNTRDIRDSGVAKGAYRLDGRWLYTHSDDTVKSDIRIEYYDSASGTYIADTYADNADTTITGNTTGAKAYFLDNSGETKKRVSANKSMKSDYYNIYADANAERGDTKWVFVGWELEIDGVRQTVSGAGTSAKILAEASGTFVAKYMPEVTGELTVTHKVDKYSEGQGSAGLRVSVINASDQIIFQNEDTDVESVYIPETFIKNDLNYKIRIELLSTPYLDDTFESIGYPAVQPEYDADPVTDDTSVPIVTTMEFDVIGDLFGGGTSPQLTKRLDYTSFFSETLHYYEVKYTFTKRDGTPGSFTSRGTLDATTYANSELISIDGSTRTLTNAFLLDYAPHESNFNKNTGIDFTAPSAVKDNIYNDGTKTHTAEVAFSETDKKYKAEISIPYKYYSSASSGEGEIDLDGNPYKKYTGQKEAVSIDGVNVNIVKKQDPYCIVFDEINYGCFLTSAEGNSQTKTSKDSETANHVNNDFITVPTEIWNQTDSKKEYFNYWAIYDYNAYKNHEGAKALVAKVYYPDFNYRLYGDYYIEPVYGESETSFVFEHDKSELGANILYLGTSRNQWNDATKAKGTYNNVADAADLIYNDFAFSFSYGQGKELYYLSDTDKSKIKLGMVLEKIQTGTGDGGTKIFAEGDTGTQDMYSYKSKYQNTGAHAAAEGKTVEETTRDKIKASLEDTNGNVKMGISGKNWVFADGTTNPSNITNSINEKGRTEQCYSYYSQLGEVIDDHSIEFAFSDDTVNYVYRAYAYILIDNGDGTKSAAVSEPAYFSMRYEAVQ